MYGSSEMAWPLPPGLAIGCENDAGETVYGPEYRRGF
jgi:hypothetical protein